MSELKLTLEPELESPSLGGVPTLTLDGAAEEKKPEEPQVPEEPELTPEEQKIVDDFVEKIDITSPTLVMQYGSGAQKKIANFSDTALQNVRTKDLGEVGDEISDLVVELNGLAARTFGSQGQTRTAALSLKLAAREIFFQETQEYPVLLLDDVLSELDAKRQSFVLNHIQGGQIFITCCEEEKLEGLEQGRSFHIHGGSLI